MKKRFTVPALLALGVVAFIAGEPDTKTTNASANRPDAFNEVAAKVYCADLIKRQLRDPDSYRFEQAKVVSNDGAYSQYGKAYISFRSKNGFGGYVRGNATCTAFEKNGALWHRAEIY